MEITIEVRRRRPPAGRISVAGRASVAFAGWLDLLALLERLLEGNLGAACGADIQECGLCPRSVCNDRSTR